MKCGRDIEDGQVFCPSCLEVMGRYPVNPGTVVILPRRREEFRRSPQRWKAPPSMEEQLRKSRRRNRWLAFFLTVMLLVSLALGGLLLLELNQEKKLLPGQNYSQLETTSPEPMSTDTPG